MFFLERIKNVNENRYALKRGKRFIGSHASYVL